MIVHHKRQFIVLNLIFIETMVLITMLNLIYFFFKDIFVGFLPFFLVYTIFTIAIL